MTNVCRVRVANLDGLLRWLIHSCVRIAPGQSVARPEATRWAEHRKSVIKSYVFWDSEKGRFSLTHESWQTGPLSISFQTDSGQAARDSGPILFAKLVECGTAKQTTVFADSVRASRTHTFSRTQARLDDSRLGGLQPARFNQPFAGRRSEVCVPGRKSAPERSCSETAYSRGSVGFGYTDWRIAFHALRA